MDRHFMPPSGDIKGNEFCTTPLSSSPFPPPNCFVPRYSLPPRFISPPGPLDASPLCRSPALEGFRYRSPVHSPNITSSPYRTPVPFGNSPVGMYGPNASFGTHSSGSFYGNYSGSRNLQRDGHKSWNGTPNNRHESGRGVKRNIPSFHQHGSNHGDHTDIYLYYNRSMLSDPWAGLTPVPVSRH